VKLLVARKLAACVAILLVACVGLFVYLTISQSHQVSKPNYTQAVLHLVVERCRMGADYLPIGEVDVTALPVVPAKSRTVLDGWDTQVRVRISPTAIEASSAGADRKWSTDDDMIYSEAR
jgi:Ca2+/Na+ antiporter